MVMDEFPVRDLLERAALFQGLEEHDLDWLADQLERVHLEEGERLFNEGDPGDSAYLIRRGRLMLTSEREETGIGEQVVGPGDVFGEESLLYEQPRGASATAVTPAEVLRIHTPLYNRLVQSYPDLKLNLVQTAESHSLARRLQFDWLGATEVVHLVARKHITRLWLMLVGPVVVFAFSLPFFYLAWLTDILTPLILALGLLLVAVLWGLWSGIDWANDYYIVTSERVVWLERVLALYESRQEAPMGTILSVGLEYDPIGRILGYGDVIVRTYTGRIIMRHVGRPEQMAALVEQYWLRTRKRSEEEESEAMERALREHLGVEEPSPRVQRDGAEPPAERQAAQETAEEEVPSPDFWNLMVASLFSLRYQEGSVITYRKHWFLLVRRIWLPTLINTALVLFLGARLLGRVSFPTTTSAVVVTVAMLTVVGGWWLYEFIDWRNDMYQVTSEHIVDIDRKPLGSEQKKSAPLENVLSLEHERTGVLGLVLNFGDVIARVGTADFTFDGVHDPAQVQQDIFNRMDERKRQQREQEAARERDRIAEWLAAYHRNRDEYPPPESYSETREESG